MASDPDKIPQGETPRQSVPRKEEDGETVCTWGFDRFENVQTGDKGLADENSDSSKFIQIYERYLEDKQGFVKDTKNFTTYCNNPQKALRQWFENEGHEFEVNTDEISENEYTCSMDLPIDDQDFTLTSDVQSKKQIAYDEICLAACKMLDECQLLYQWELGADGSNKEDPDRKRRFAEANKEDDIELDSTGGSKRRAYHLESERNLIGSARPKMNTYESLMAKWHELNRTILQLKTKLVKLDLSVTKPGQNSKNTNDKSVNEHSNQASSQGTVSAGDDDDDSIDPLDEFMSSLETSKSKLSMDEKIEKSRIKAEIGVCEREQEQVARLIELAKPNFDLNKACPTKAAASPAAKSCSSR